MVVHQHATFSLSTHTEAHHSHHAKAHNTHGHTMHAGTPCTTLPWNATELAICICMRSQLSPCDFFDPFCESVLFKCGLRSTPCILHVHAHA